jgi:hypothetical protein
MNSDSNGFGCGLSDIDDFSSGFGSEYEFGFGYGIGNGFGSEDCGGSSGNFCDYVSSHGLEDGSGYGDDDEKHLVQDLHYDTPRFTCSMIGTGYGLLHKRNLINETHN